MNKKIVQTTGKEQLGEFAPMFAHLNDDVLFGEVWNVDAIDVKNKCIITVVSLMASGITDICVGGRGYYQEWGKDAIEMNPGDVINIPANIKRWHGAAPDSWFSHLAVEINGEETSNEWLEAVSDENYGKLK